MKNLYLILRKNSNHTTFDLLKKSAEEKGITVKQIHTDDFSFSQKPNLTHEDAIYRIAIDANSSLIEKYLINENTIGFYSNYLNCIGKLDNVIEYSLIHQKFNIPIIKTIFSVPTNKDHLKESIDELGGFPVILKTLGGMHGIGVMKIDSYDSLFSIIDYLENRGEKFVLRKFIEHEEQARIIVLGDKVIASHANFTSNDFRTNVGDNSTRKRAVKSYDKKIHDMAVKAVQSLGYEFGGVDILFSKKTNEPHIAEVNFPCFFPRTQELTGVDIAGAMIDYLIDKSNNHTVVQ